MSRDLEERLSLFADCPIDLHRIALNMEQVREVNPPENPAKVTDSRFEGYMKIHGTKSWELDALSPTYLARLLEGQITQYVDQDSWDEVREEVEHVRTTLINVAKELE